MGYTTSFEGRFELDKPLNPDQVAYVKKFHKTRRMRRNAETCGQLPDPLRKAINLPIGEEAGYFVSGEGFCGQDRDENILDYNQPPKGQPGLWCQWEPTDDGRFIEWDGSEKFYNYIEWIEYYIEHFFKSWGLKLTGNVFWSGEDPTDIGIIKIRDNTIFITNILEQLSD